MIIYKYKEDKEKYSAGKRMRERIQSIESDEKTFDSWKGEEADMFRTKEDAVTDALKEDLDKTVKLAEQMRYLLSKSERA